MKIYELSKIPGIGNEPFQEPDYEAIFNSGYSAGYEDGYDSFVCYMKMALTFEVLSNDYDWGINLFYVQDQGLVDAGIEYSLDMGKTWTKITQAGQGPLPLPVGGTVQFRANAQTGPEDGFAWIRGSYGMNFKVYGNIMSMIYGSGFTGQTEFQSEFDSFGGFFRPDPEHSSENIGLIDATNLVLPAKTLNTGCYEGMFRECINLTGTPGLPATTLADGCYRQMFFDCTSLTDAPELPATRLTDNCYEQMFRRCTSLTGVPELNATALAQGCYDSMFLSCTTLTQAPELPATVLANWCYHGMFEFCTNLENGPSVLPAEILVYNCYSNMFQGCSKLNHMKCLATDYSAESCINWFLNATANTGVFEKKAGVVWPEPGYDPNIGYWIPSGWTVVDA